MLPDLLRFLDDNTRFTLHVLPRLRRFVTFCFRRRIFLLYLSEKLISFQCRKPGADPKVVGGE